MKTLHLTHEEHHIITAITEAVRLGIDAHAAAQRAKEEIDGTGPVSGGSDEETEIWLQIHDLFDKVKDAPDRIYTVGDLLDLRKRYLAIVGSDEKLGLAQAAELMVLIGEAPLKPRKQNYIHTEGFWVYTARDARKVLAVSISADGSHRMCVKPFTEIEGRV